MVLHLRRFLPIVVVAALTFLVAGSGRLAVLATAGVVAGLLAAAGAMRPAVAAGVAVAAIALVPTYALPGWVPIVTVPVGVIALLLVPAAASRLQEWRVIPLDVAVAAFAVLQIIAAAISLDVVRGPAITVVSRIMLPYACFRLLGLVPGARRAAAAGAVAIAVVLSLVAFGEAGGSTNPFFSWAQPGPQATQWARPELRFDQVRAEASFGHPIALGLFLALAVVLAAGFIVVARTTGARVAAAIAAALGAAGLLMTLSRGPVLVLVVAVVAWALFVVRRVGLPKMALAAMLIGGLVLLTSAGSVVGRLIDSSSGGTAEAASAEYRFEVFQVLGDAHQFSFLGKQSDLAEGTASDQLRSRVGLKSIDSEFVRVYATSGLLGLAAFLLIGMLLLRTAAGSGLDAVDRAWAVGLAATYLGVTVVALITQHADLFWVATGVAGAIEQQQSSGVSLETQPLRASHATS